MEIVTDSMADPNSYIVVFGQSWGPKEVADRTFGFYPAQGIHDVHCNQYNGHMSQSVTVHGSEQLQFCDTILDRVSTT